MKSLIITIEGMEQSEAAANSCIKRAKQFDVNVEIQKAVTPEDNPGQLFGDLGIRSNHFYTDEVYSRRENAMAAFLSHRSCWEVAANSGKSVLVLEHDAYFLGPIPSEVEHIDAVVNLGKPSYGKYIRPISLGIGPLTSKRYFPGAHAYAIGPGAAKKALEMSIDHAAPTDLFFHVDLFGDLLKEYYPWPIEARDSFTTIQKDMGCYAKHRYNEGYEIL